MNILKTVHGYTINLIGENKMNSKHIPITFSVDDNYVKHASVVIVSILKNSDPLYNYDFILFDNGIKAETKGLLEKVIVKFPNASLQFFDIRNKTKQFLTTNIKTSAIFDRLFLPEVLKGYKKVIQLDADMVVVGDISQLFKEDISQYYVGCVVDYFIQQHIKDLDTVWLRNVKELERYNWNTYTCNYLQLKHPDTYFNAGMMLMNLDLMRKHKISNKLVDYLLKHQPLALCDQDVLNAVIGDCKKILSPKWNFVIDYSIFYPNGECYKNAKKSPFILHRKLWDDHYLHGYSEYYYKYLPEEFSNFQKREIETVSEKDITFVCTGKILNTGKYTTYKSLKSIRKYFPQSKIILSTWEGEDISQIKNLYDEIIINEKMLPQYSAHLENCPWKAPNTYDLQQYSVNKGLQSCKTKYAVRMRTDFILQNRNFLQNYNKLNKVFDAYEADCKIFNQRVLIHETLTINPHAQNLAFTQHPADIFHFGLKEDLLKLWNGAFMPKGVYNYFNEHHDLHNPCCFASQYIIEQYLWVSLLERSNKGACIPYYYLETSPRLIELTDRFFVSNFIILDEKKLGIESKFDKIQYSQKYRFFSFKHFCEEYIEHVDKKNTTVQDILKLYLYKEKSNQFLTEFFKPFVYIFRKIKIVYKWGTNLALFLLFRIKYRKKLLKLKISKLFF